MGDDGLQKINTVIRSKDLFQVTHIHRLLQALLELPSPTYCHHPLLMDNEGKRIAKRTEETQYEHSVSKGINQQICWRRSNCSPQTAQIRKAQRLSPAGSGSRDT